MARFDSVSTAEVAAAKLKEAGISCHITAGQVPGLPMFYDRGQASVRLQVADEQLEEAHEVLDESSGELE